MGPNGGRIGSLGSRFRAGGNRRGGLQGVRFAAAPFGRALGCAVSRAVHAGAFHRLLAATVVELVDEALAPPALVDDQIAGALQPAQMGVPLGRASSPDPLENLLPRKAHRRGRYTLRRGDSADPVAKDIQDLSGARQQLTGGVAPQRAEQAIGHGEIFAGDFDTADDLRPDPPGLNGPLVLAQKGHARSEG